MSCGADLRLGSDPALLWLWCRLAATILITPLTWEPPHAMGAALEKAKKKKKKIRWIQHLCDQFVEQAIMVEFE